MSDEPKTAENIEKELLKQIGVTEKDIEHYEDVLDKSSSVLEFFHEQIHGSSDERTDIINLSREQQHIELDYAKLYALLADITLAVRTKIILETNKDITEQSNEFKKKFAQIKQRQQEFIANIEKLSYKKQDNTPIY